MAPVVLHGRLVCVDHTKAELLNEYFSSVFTVDNGVIDKAKQLLSVPADYLRYFYSLSGVKIHYEAKVR